MRLKHTTTAGFILLGQVYARNAINLKTVKNQTIVQNDKSKLEAKIPLPTDQNSANISKNSFFHPFFILHNNSITPQDTFQCWSELKINITLRCDCNNDCGDWEDEMDCPRKPSNSEFVTCEGDDSFGPHRCIPKKWLCDGLDQCGNEWDESENACDIRKKYSASEKGINYLL